MRPKRIIYARTQTPQQNPAHPGPPTPSETERAREAASSLDVDDRGIAPGALPFVWLFVLLLIAYSILEVVL